MRRTVAVLVAALAVGVSPAVARDTTTGTTSDAARSWLRTRAALAERMPYVHNAKAGDVWHEWAEVVDAGDLDGDGRSDVIDVRSRVEEDDNLGFRETVRLDAYRGSDGAALWTHTLPTASWVFPYVTKVGLDGKPGVVVASYDAAGPEVDEVGGGAGSMLLTSLDRTGTPVWARAFGGTWGWGPAGYAGGATAVDGFFDAVAGGGTDVLLRTVVDHVTGDPTGTVDQQGSALHFELVDGATGVVRPLGQPFLTESPDAYSVTTGDLDGDKLDDFAVEVVTGDVPSLVAFSSADGRKLWEIGRYATGENMLLALPDVTGDGRADIGVRSFVFGPPIIVLGPHESPISPTPPRVTLIDGGRGKVLWRKDASSLAPLGNIDGRPGAEVAVTNEVGPFGGSIGFRAAAYTATGRKVWSVTRTLRYGSGFPGGSSYGVIGDVHGDGVAEIGYALVTAGRSPRRDEGTINGRTGRVVRDPRPDMRATRAALDGRGADAFERTAARGILTLHAWRGDRPQRLWSAAVRLKGSWLRSTPLSVDGDKCGDLAATLLDGESTFRSVVYSGSTGRPLWTLERTGNAAAKVSKPSVVSHRTFTRGC